MLKTYKSTIGSKILEYDSGNLLGFVNGIIIDPDTGKVEAFWIRSVEFSKGRVILRVLDILEIKKHLYVRSDSVLAQAEDVIRISEILEDGRTFLGNSVQNEGGHFYGYCDDITFDSQTFLLKQIHVRRMFMGLFVLSERTFSYGRLICVLPEMILVDDDATNKESLMVSTSEAAAG